MLKLTANNLTIKDAKRTIEFVREMANAEFYDHKDIQEMGLYDNENRSFVQQSRIAHIEGVIRQNPQRYNNTTAFGINVSMNFGFYSLIFVKHQKGCNLIGSCTINTTNQSTDADRKLALNDFLWGVYVSESIQTHILPNLKIIDDFNYHKSKPNREMLKQWKFNDSNRGTTFLRDYNNLENHDLNHLLDVLGWSQSLINTPIGMNGCSARMNLLRDTLSDEPNEYSHITHIKKLCELVWAYMG